MTQISTTTTNARCVPPTGQQNLSNILTAKKKKKNTHKNMAESNLQLQRSPTDGKAVEYEQTCWHLERYIMAGRSFRRIPFLVTSMANNLRLFNLVEFIWQAHTHAHAHKHTRARARTHTHTQNTLSLNILIAKPDWQTKVSTDKVVCDPL